MSGAVVGNLASEYASNAYDKKVGGIVTMGDPSNIVGARRWSAPPEVQKRASGRGRPRKEGGGASMSKAYKQALKNNFGGLEVAGLSGGRPLSNYKVNPKVGVSSSEMTLSPYQRLDSPAMNPFIPSVYTQEGGQSCGYAGRGLYGGGLF